MASEAAHRASAQEAKAAASSLRAHLDISASESDAEVPSGAKGEGDDAEVPSGAKGEGDGPEPASDTELKSDEDSDGGQGKCDMAAEGGDHKSGAEVEGEAHTSGVEADCELGNTRSKSMWRQVCVEGVSIEVGLRRNCVFVEATLSAIQAVYDIALKLTSSHETKPASKWQKKSDDPKLPQNVYYRYDRHQYCIRYQAKDGECRYKTAATVEIDNKCSPEEILKRRKTAFESAVEVWNKLDLSGRPRMSAEWGELGSMA